MTREVAFRLVRCIFLSDGPSFVWSGKASKLQFSHVEGRSPSSEATFLGNYANDKMNMRLILASKNAVALDTVESLVMKCDPTKVPSLTKLDALGFGTTDIGRINVVGKQISEVEKPFAGGQTAVCPGK
jgi:hypothetical protein